MLWHLMLHSARHILKIVSMNRRIAYEQLSRYGAPFNFKKISKPKKSWEELNCKTRYLDCSRPNDLLNIEMFWKVMQKLPWRKCQILIPLYTLHDIQAQPPPQTSLSDLSLSLAISLFVKEMASSNNLVVFLAMLLVLLPMAALGSNHTSPFDSFLGTFIILFFLFIFYFLFGSLTHI
jgi:hypothetical protein